MPRRAEPKLDLTVTVHLDFIPLTPYLTHNHHAHKPNLIEIKDFQRLQQLMTKLKNVIAINNKNLPAHLAFGFVSSG